MSHVKFVLWTARMPDLDNFCNSFRAAGINGCLDFSLFLLAACCSFSWPCRMWPGSKHLRLAKESVAPWERSSAGRMAEITRGLSVGVGRRHPVTMRKASLRTLSMRKVCTLRHQAGAQYSAVKQIRNKAAVCYVWAPAPHPKPATRLSSEMRVDSFLRNA